MLIYRISHTTYTSYDPETIKDRKEFYYVFTILLRCVHSKSGGVLNILRSFTFL